MPKIGILLVNFWSDSARRALVSASVLAIVLLIAKMLVGSMCSFRDFYQAIALGDIVLSINFFLILPTP